MRMHLHHCPSQGYSVCACRRATCWSAWLSRSTVCIHACRVSARVHVGTADSGRRWSCSCMSSRLLAEVRHRCPCCARPPEQGETEQLTRARRPPERGAPSCSHLQLFRGCLCAAVPGLGQARPCAVSRTREALPQGVMLFRRRWHLQPPAGWLAPGTSVVRCS